MRWTVGSVDAVVMAGNGGKGNSGGTARPALVAAARPVEAAHDTTPASRRGSAEPFRGPRPRRRRFRRPARPDWSGSGLVLVDWSGTRPVGPTTFAPAPGCARGIPAGTFPVSPAVVDVFGIGAIRRFFPDRLTSISPARSSCTHAARTVSRDTPTWAATDRSPGSSSPGRNTPLSTCSRTHRNTRPRGASPASRIPSAGIDSFSITHT
ncbi:MAG: hypothetical protein AAGA25_11570 [Planctomycetota bacterium]